jgi:radical SAM protein with 4Fe4S-binding SPASM domain
MTEVAQHFPDRLLPTQEGINVTDRIPSLELVVQPYRPGDTLSVGEGRQMAADGPEEVRFAWFELTGQCQEECTHCYAGSGPDGTHGTMSVEDWAVAIDQLAEVGTTRMQFIGGEPTLHPYLPQLIEHAIGRGMGVEVYTNMVHINPGLKELFTARRDRVSLATSYYSPDPTVHRQITGRDTHRPIQKNIQWAIDSGVPLRVGIIGVQEGQGIEGAKAELVEMGVDQGSIGVDYVRQVGRGVHDEVTPETTSQLCGNCADGVVAVLPDGNVQPCVFSRQSDFRIGNLHEQPLLDVLGSERMVSVRGLLRAAFATRDSSDCQPCRPDCPPNCSPAAGNPCKPACVPRGLGMEDVEEYLSADGCRPDDSCRPDDFCKPDTQCRPDDYCRPHVNNVSGINGDQTFEVSH